MNNIKYKFWIIIIFFLISIASVKAAITDNTVAYLNLNNNTYDSSSFNLNFTDTGPTVNVTGKLLDGRNKTTASHRLTSSSVVTLSTNWSWSLWVYLEGNANAPTFIGYRDDGASKYGYTCDFTATNRYMHCYIRNGAGWSEITSNTSIPLNQWVLVSLSMNSAAGYVFYLNTTPIGTGTTAQNMGSPMYLIGMNGYSNTAESYKFGLADEIWFLNRTLLQSEVTTIWNNGIGLTYPFVSCCSIAFDTSSIPVNNSYTFNTTPNFQGNITSIIGTWNISISDNGTDKGVVQRNTTGAFNITSSALTTSSLHQWYFKATDITNTSNTATTASNYLYVAGTCSATAIKTCVFTAGCIGLSCISSCS